LKEELQMPRDQEKDQRERGLLHTLFIILVITLLTIVFVEMGFRVIRAALINKDAPADPRAEADGYKGASWTNQYFKELHDLQTVWKSYVYWRRARFQGKYINIDNNGIRKTWNMESGDRKEKYKILCLGGSGMWGFGARDDHTIASRISKILTERLGMAVSVVNMGETGYVSSQEFIALSLELQAGRVPDLVIFYDGVNDIFSAFQNGRAGLPQNERNRRREFNLLITDTRSILTLFGPMMLSRTAIYKTMRDLAQKGTIGGYRDWTMGLKDKEIGVDEASKLSRSVARVYGANMELISGLAQKYDFKVRHYWQPTVFQKDHCSDYEAGFKESMKNVAPLFKEAYESVGAAPSIKKAGTTFKDLSNLFKNMKEPVFIDFCHITEEGNKRIARAIVENLLDGKVLRNHSDSTGSGHTSSSN
jgi:lysophospholipase L1-like esterase